MLPADSQKSGGYSLIEVLVALVVFSIGLLGLARLQLAGLTNAASAATRLEAVNLSYDMLERMRANRTAALAGNYTVALGGASSAGGIAQADVEAWKAALAAGLPAGDGAIEANGRVITITVQWSEEWDDQLEPQDGKAAVRLRTQL
jgi:type IV pilus assembly protein PilV